MAGMEEMEDIIEMEDTTGVEVMTGMVAMTGINSINTYVMKKGEHHYNAGLRGYLGYEQGRLQDEKITDRNNSIGVGTGLYSSGDGKGIGGH